MVRFRQSLSTVEDAEANWKGVGSRAYLGHRKYSECDALYGLHRFRKFLRVTLVSKLHSAEWASSIFFAVI
jgi:hypothetical protein